MQKAPTSVGAFYLWGMTIEALHKLLLLHPEVSTDSRKIPENGIFFALKGPNFNGNAFAREALVKGAALAVVDEAEYAIVEGIILVEDVLQCLQQLATYHRDYCKTPVIALTGSNGKTTTKELIAGVLRKRYNTLATAGNLNNHIGVPLTLLRLRPETEMAVVEMGANHQGEIGFLCSLAKPDYGYITNFGKAHLEGFGGVEGVIRGKSEMYDYLTANGKTVFMNADDPIQRQRLATYPYSVGFSTKDPSHYPIAFLEARPFVELLVEGTRIHTRLMGAYNFPNCAAAALIGHYFDVPAQDIREALEAYTPSNNRSQLLERGAIRIILDAYNANPTSMGAALEHFRQLGASKKIAILGDMFELGPEAGPEHLAIGQLAESLGLDRLYLVGANFLATGLPEARYPDFEALKAELSQRPLEGPATVLIKGSRGMALERVLDCI